jgi:hypothetical protein
LQVSGGHLPDLRGISDCGHVQDDNELSSSACRVPIFAFNRESEQLFAMTAADRAHHAITGRADSSFVRLDSILKGQSHQSGDILYVTSLMTDQHLEMLLLRATFIASFL